MKRIDVLGETDRAGLFGGDVLSSDPDETLQQLVERAAEELGAPVAAVTLILDRIQHFRAHVGLPPEVAAAGAVDRDVSFCQLVVRDEAPLEVNDAREDERVPQELVDRYGIRSYLGAPVRAGGAVVGALCVIDFEERGFEPDERQSLQRLADEVTERLGELAQARPDTTEIATRPAFAELREALVPLSRAVASARIATAELAPLARLTEKLAGSEREVASALQLLRRASEAAARLEALHAAMEDASRSALSTVAALEGTMAARRGQVSVADLVQHASHLSHGVSALSGGIRWPDVDPLVLVEVDRRVAITDLTALVVICAGLMHARGCREGIGVTAGVTRDRVALEVAVPDVDQGALRQALVPVLLAESGVLRVADARVTLELNRAPLRARR